MTDNVAPIITLNGQKKTIINKSCWRTLDFKSLVLELNALLIYLISAVHTIKFYTVFNGVTVTDTPTLHTFIYAGQDIGVLQFFQQHIFTG